MIHPCECKACSAGIIFCPLHESAGEMREALEKIVAFGHHLVSDDCGGRECSRFCPACVAQRAITEATDAKLMDR